MSADIKQEKKLLRVKQGTVVSNKMDKTAVVNVESRKKHPLYKKTIKISKKFKIHDPNNECNEGDIVRFVECRPLSKDKKFRLVSIFKKGENIEDVKIEKSLEEVINVQKNIPEEQLKMKEEKSAGDSSQEATAPITSDS